MRLIHINEINPGTKIAKPIYDSKLSLLVQKDATLSSNLIEKLKQIDIRHVYVEDEISKGIVLEPMIPDILKLQAITLMKMIYELHDQGNGEKPKQVREEHIRSLRAIIDDMISEIYDQYDKKYYSTELMGAEMYHYDHAVEVMILSVLIGKKMGLDRERLLKLGMGAILSDIGKSKVPDHILNKKGKLEPNEFEQMKRHVEYGYDMVKELVELSPLSRQIILLHHEKLDGSGYPNGFVADQIPLLVRIVTICDIFSAIVSDRTYNNRISVDVALEILRSAAPVKLDADIINYMLQIVDMYPPGTLVELSTGDYAIVIENNLSAPTRPILRVIKGDQFEVIDMMKDLTIFIKKVIPRLPNS